MQTIELRCENSREAEKLKAGLIYSFGERNGNLDIEIKKDELGYCTKIVFEQTKITLDELTGFWQGINFLLKNN